MKFPTFSQHLVLIFNGFNVEFSHIWKKFSDEFSCNLVVRDELTNSGAEHHIPYFPAYKTHFFPEKCDLNSNCVLYAEGKYLFPNL
jgi:hypothetical protein